MRLARPDTAEETETIRDTVTLVVHSDPTQQSWLAEVIGRENAVVGAGTVPEAVGVLEEQPIDLLVAEASACTPALIEALESRRLGVRTVFLDGPEDGDAKLLVDALAAGHVFNVLQRPVGEGDLLRCLHRLLFPRGTERHEGLGCYVGAALPDGSSVLFPVIDLSNRGLSLRMSSAAGHGLLLPDTTLTSLWLERDGRTLLDGMHGVVRYIELAEVTTDGRPPDYKVGIELVAPRRDSSDAPDQIIRDGVRIRALLQEAARVGPIALRGPHDDARTTVVLRVELEPASGRLRFLGPPPTGFTVGDVLCGTFGLSGRTYSFFAAVSSVSPGAPAHFEVRMPTTLSAAHRRGSPRIQPRPGEPVFVELVSPFDGVRGTHPVLDVTTSGLSFVVDDELGLFPVGTRLESVSVHFGGILSLRSRARVRSLSHVLDGGVARLRCGIEFQGLSSIDRTRLADAIVYRERPQVRDASGTPFAEVWAFLERTGFLYADKLKRLDVPAVQATMTRLLEHPNPVFKTFLYNHDGEIQAHLSSVRLYGSTWGIQHLASARTADAAGKARFLNLAIAEYLAQTPEIEWLKVTYRPENDWPAFIFGRFARRIGASPLSHIATYGYLTSPTSLEGRPCTTDGDELHVRPARPSDLSHIEAHLVSRGNLVGLRADDLSRESLALERISYEYRRLGLERRREVLVAERKGRFAGFALLQVSSPGLNFSELTNTFSVHLREEDPALGRMLAEHARARYAELGRDLAIALVPIDRIELLTSAGFEHRKNYVSWTWHRSLFQQFYEYVLRMMDGDG